MSDVNLFGLTFHHFGLAVRKQDRAIFFLRDLNYRIGQRIYDELQNVNLIMCEHDQMPDVELIYPADSPGPLDNWLRDQHSIIYHLCYTCDNLDLTLSRLRDRHRIITISPPKSAILFDYKLVSFYQVHGFGIIEIIENSAKL
jgi:hypothetical protein